MSVDWGADLVPNATENDVMIRILCKFGFHSWKFQSEEWNLPREKGHLRRYICQRCYSAKKTIQITNAKNQKGHCVAITVEEWKYERGR